MKKLMFVSLLVLFSASSVWAQPHPVSEPDGQVTNNAVAMMNEHERAILAHQSMDNANSAAHQSIIDMHRRMMQQEK